MTNKNRISKWLLTASIPVLLCSCKEYEKYNQQPELESLRQGLRVSVAVSYCVSIANSAFKGNNLPDNVSFDRNLGLIHIEIDSNYPLPFNESIGDIVIACLYNENSGVMSISFADIDLLSGRIKFYGLYTVPFTEREGEGIWAMYAQQDIILGEGTDTLLNLSNVTPPVFDAEISRLNSKEPSDIFVAVKQNAWFINIDQANTYDNPYDDNITINGGGQIAEVRGESGGIVYHAMIATKVNYSVCPLNPIAGHALTQNFEAGGEPYIDLGNSLLTFHDNNCDGLVYVEFSSGKYMNYKGKYIPLSIR